MTMISTYIGITLVICKNIKHDRIDILLRYDITTEKEEHDLVVVGEGLVVLGSVDQAHRLPH